jgi:hypothetical protein
VVVPDRAQLSEIVRRVRDGRVRTNIGNIATLNDAVAAFNPTMRAKGKTIILWRSSSSPRYSPLVESARTVTRLCKTVPLCSALRVALPLWTWGWTYNAVQWSYAMMTTTLMGPMVETEIEAG